MKPPLLQVVGSSLRKDGCFILRFDNKSLKQASHVTQRRFVLFAVLTGVLVISVITGIVFGVMALQSHQEFVDVVKDWDDIRNIADTMDINADILADDDRDNISRDDDADKIIATQSYEIKPMERKINFDALWEVNKQILCWIYIPGTDIDYPILREKEVGSYYWLEHNVRGTPVMSGCIVTDVYANDSAHFTVLGHNMKNASMFGTLRTYRSFEFYQNQPYVYLYYPDRVERWEVWSAFSTNCDDMIYDTPYNYNTEAFSSLVSHIQNSKMYNTNINNTDPSKQVLTLSTCEDTDGTKRGRFVVNCLCCEVVNY